MKVASVIVLYTSIGFSYFQDTQTNLQKVLELIPENTEESITAFNELVEATPDEDDQLALYAQFVDELERIAAYDQVLELSNRGLQINLNDSNYYDYIELVSSKFSVFRRRNEYDSAIQTLNLMESLAHTNSDTTVMIVTLVERGSLFEFTGDYVEALELHLEGLRLANASKDSSSIAEAFLNLAILYQKIDEFDLAFDYNKKAVKTFIKLGKPIKAAQIYNNIGLTYDDLGHNINDTKLHDTARVYYLKAYTITVEQGNELGQAINKLNLGLNAYRRNEFKEAIQTFDEVIVFFRSIEDPFGECLCYLNYCRIYKDIGQTNKAIEYALSGYKLADENEFLNERQFMAKALWQLYDQKNEVENAYNYFQKYVADKDTLSSKEKEREIGRLESKLDLNSKILENKFLEQEINLKSKTISSQRLTLAGVFLIAILLIAIVFLFRNQLKERKKLLVRIEKQSEKLKELDQAKTRFFANISHDLRSPLTLILGAINRISEREYDILDKESKDLLNIGYKNGKRLLYMADEIMDLTRLEEGKIELDLQYVKIAPYLRLLTKMFSSAADIKKIELRYESIADSETIIQLDPHQFEKIIYNLLSNAIKFTPVDGKVDILLETDNQHVKIRISDSGTGIPEHSINHIFDRFYQSNENEFQSQEGVGIGLALVKELVELHGGNITVRSSSNGTDFIIQLPFKESNWVSQAIVPERSLDIVTRNSLWVDLQDEKDRRQVSSLTNTDPNAKVVLIVEDHRELRTYLKSLISSDYRVLLASNGSEALTILESDKVDLVITDLMMPYMDGFELIDHLKKDKTLKKLPILVVSARTGKEEKLALLSKGASEVINKPFDKDELLLRIRNLFSNEVNISDGVLDLYKNHGDEFEKSIMSRLERLILSRVDDPHLSVLDLADEMAASERKVYRMIKKISGMTPYELIKEVRWQYLEKYLGENEVRNATEAAGLIGMNNVSSFSEQFKKRFNTSFQEFNPG